MPTAMGRSKRPPSLGKSAGDKFTVMRPAGKSNPAVSSAERTRSLLSRTTASGSPTMAKAGNPGPKCTSTRTSGAESPAGARLRTVLTRFSTPPPGRRLGRRKIRFDVLQPLLHGGERRLRSRQQCRLHIELLPVHQIELRQLGLQDRLEIALQVPAEAAHRRGYRLRQAPCELIQ